MQYGIPIILYVQNGRITFNNHSSTSAAIREIIITTALGLAAIRSIIDLT